MQTILDQLTFDHLFALYLGVCIGIALWWIAICGYEDIRMCREPWRKATSKFGYNYKSSFSWIVLAFLSLPIVNIITAIMFTGIAIRNSMRKPNAKPV